MNQDGHLGNQGGSTVSLDAPRRSKDASVTIKDATMNAKDAPMSAKDTVTFLNLGLGCEIYYPGVRL